MRALRGHVTDLSGVAFKTDDALKFAFLAETTSKMRVLRHQRQVLHASMPSKLPGGRGHGEPVRLFIDLEQDADIVAAFKHGGGRKFLIASAKGNGFVVPEDECLGQHPQGQAGAQRQGAGQGGRDLPGRGRHALRRSARTARCWSSLLDQVPEMTRGAGVRLQRYKDGILTDIMTFDSKGEGHELVRLALAARS